MGKLEKIVVLGVLFLITLIIVLSLSTGPVDETGADSGQIASNRQELSDTRVARRAIDRSPETSTPLERPSYSRPSTESSTGSLGRDLPETSGYVAGPEGASRDSEASADPSMDGSASTGANTGATGLGLLSSSVTAQRESQRPGPRIQLKADWDLETTRGLTPSTHPNFLLYRCERGDTFEGVAQALYGDAAKAGLLERNNEGLARLESGLEILVPVRDDRGPDAGEYVVQEGESLWVISKRFYGQGSRWGEIFEANRDQLASPEGVRVGMTLVIP